ncbi:hypothetical protein LINPERHAP2_LOCUS2420 [Linum perenne]
MADPVEKLLRDYGRPTLEGTASCITIPDAVRRLTNHLPTNLVGLIQNSAFSGQLPQAIDLANMTASQAWTACKNFAMRIKSLVQSDSALTLFPTHKQLHRVTKEETHVVTVSQADLDRERQHSELLDQIKLLTKQVQTSVMYGMAKNEKVEPKPVVAKPTQSNPPQAYIYVCDACGGNDHESSHCQQRNFCADSGPSNEQVDFIGGQNPQGYQGQYHNQQGYQGNPNRGTGNYQSYQEGNRYPSGNQNYQGGNYQVGNTQGYQNNNRQFQNRGNWNQNPQQNTWSQNRNQLGSTSTNLPPPGFPAPQQKSNIELLLERLVADNQKRDNSVQSLEKQMLTMQQVLLQQAKGKGTMPSMPIQNPKRDENLGAIVTRSGYSGRT